MIIARTIGPYVQDNAGVWYTRNPQHGIVRVPSASRGLRSYQHLALARRYGRKSFVFEGRLHTDS